jgi:hypothetical protein
MTELRCPQCAGRRIAEIDRIPGYARVAAVTEDGTIDWDGETLVDWNGQEPPRPLSSPAWTATTRLDCRLRPAVLFVAASKEWMRSSRDALGDFEFGTASKSAAPDGRQGSIALARRIFTGDDIA